MLLLNDVKMLTTSTRCLFYVLMQINAISILLKYIVTLKLAVDGDLLTGSFPCRVAKYILGKKMAFSLSSYI